jgi:hypothetical protein
LASGASLARAAVRRRALRAPEQPAIRREKSMYTPHATPMKRPPMKASRGRKVDIVLAVGSQSRCTSVIVSASGKVDISLSRCRRSVGVQSRRVSAFCLGFG